MSLPQPGLDAARSPGQLLSATPGQLSWLRSQTAVWQVDGILDADQAQRILERYSESRRFSLGRLLLTLGACFLGIGLIWLVAANLEQLSPAVRFGAVAALWLASLVGGEVLAARRASRLVVEAVRLVAAFAFGAVIFQAAQSLQVPAYDPKLVGLWAAGTLVHAYVLKAWSPLLVGIAAGVGWSIWQGLFGSDPTFTRAVWVLLLTALLAVSIGALHSRWQTRFTEPWRHVGAGLVLVALFVAGFPVSESWDMTWAWWPILLGVLAPLTALTAIIVARGARRWEVLGTVGVTLLGLGLVAWPTASQTSDVGMADWGHALFGVLGYVAVAVGIAAVGTVSDSRLLTTMATLGLVVFTTFQSFAVFASIISGAWLFVVIGAIFLVTGVGFDRARRQLATTLEQEA